MRRKPGALVPLELALCHAAAQLNREVHGFELAKTLADGADRKALTAYGTLYRALARLEAMQLFTSRWEDPLLAAAEGRPLRRLYTLTALGESALAEGLMAATRKGAVRRRRKLATV